MSDPSTNNAGEAKGRPVDRRAVLETLALGTREELQSALAAIGEPQGWTFLRKAETGLVMVRGRAGGGGMPFNLGEATVTRASVALACGTVGHAYGLGRDKDKAQAAALLDALWQTSAREKVEALAVLPIRVRVDDARRQREEEAAATTVDFFTLARESE